MLEVYYTQGGVVEEVGGWVWGRWSLEAENIWNKSLELLLMCVIIMLVIVFIFTVAFIKPF